MKKSMLLSFVVLGIVVWSGCRGKKIENQWTSQEIIVDGKSEDWEAAPLTYAKETNMAMGVTNNAENIYVMFRLNDPGTARRIQKMGFTVWLNKDGKKKKTFGINYRGSSGMQHELKPVEVPSEMGGGTRPDRMKAMMERFSVDLPDFGKIRLIENGEERDIPENNLEGPAAGFALSNGYYCYEFRMPIPINVELGTEVKLCMELGGLTDENMKKIREEMMSGMGGGGRPGGGMTGGGMGGRRGGRSGGRGGRRGGGRPGGMQQPGQGLEKQDLWFTVVLATEK